MTPLRPLLFLGVLAAAVVSGPFGAVVALAIAAVNEFLVVLGDLRTNRLPTETGRWRPGAWLRWLVGRLRRGSGPDNRAFPDYGKVRSDLAWAQYSRRDFDMAMRKRLLNAAALRLDKEYGVDLERDHDKARRLLGEPAWEVLRPADEASQDRFARGVALPDIERVVDAIEGLKKESA